jgi:dTDP-glucose 4,6-dehydratase
VKTILVTGVAGFIFSNFIHKAYSEKWPYRIIGVDKIVQPYNLKNINKDMNPNFYMGDIADKHFMENVFKIEEPDYVINGAAESFVDHSIASAIPFVHSNILGTQVMVDLSVKYKVKKFIQISTDEVYGQLKSKDDAPWTEDSCISPRNPYSATKGAAELLVKAAIETHQLPAMITRCSNNYGGRQPIRNLIPVVIDSIMNDKEIPIHGSGLNIREWIFVDDHNSAIMTVLENGILGETYNIGSGVEKTNIEIVDEISRIMETTAIIKHVEDRKGHDFRYSVDCSKIKKIGWSAKTSFKDGMRKTINWYMTQGGLYL